MVQDYAVTPLEEISNFLATTVPGLVSDGHDLQLACFEHSPVRLHHLHTYKTSGDHILFQYWVASLRP